MTTHRIASLLVVVAFALLSACNISFGPDGTSGNDYCDLYRRGDLWRIPLVYPHEIISADGFSWVFPIPKNPKIHKISIDEIENIGVFEDSFTIHSSGTSISGVGIKEAWFVMHGDDLSYFIDSSEYAAYLDSIDVQIDLHHIDSVYKDFSGEKAVLPWDCTGK